MIPLQTITAPADGLCVDMDADVYHRVRAMNASTLKSGLKSMRHLRHALDSPPTPPTPAMLLGKMLHTAVFEPEKYATIYRTGPLNPKTNESYGVGTKAFNEAAEEAAKEGYELVASGDLIKVESMRAEIMLCEDARRAVENSEHREVSLFWTRDGEKCKGRPDSVKSGGGFFHDLKTCSNISEYALQRAVWSLGYDISAAWYVDGWKRLYGETLPVFLTFVETEPPWCVVMYELDPDAIEVGRQRGNELWRAYQASKASGDWWVVPPQEDLPMLSLPEWAMRQYDNAIAEPVGISDDESPF